VQNYNTGTQRGAIQPDIHASGWVVRNVSAVRNYWAGLMAAKILVGHSNDNDQLGIAGNTATGVLLDGLDGDPTTLEDWSWRVPTRCTRPANGRLVA
jgi:hypothetical protein